MQLIKSARRVCPVAKTFHNDWVPGSTFDHWFARWEQGLTGAERTLWQYMQELRNWDEHGDGAPLVPVAIPVPVEGMYVNIVLHGLDVATQTTGSKGSVGFAKYPKQRASEVCAPYLALCQKFVNDFLSDPQHAALIAPPGAASTASPAATKIPSP